MALMTARPWKDPKTGVYHLRQRTPRDLLVRVKGQTVSLPIADTFVSVKVGDAVQASLRTKEAAEARTRHAVADGALKRFWEAQKAGPVSLTQRQIIALSGLVYADLTKAWSDEPGPSEAWSGMLRLHQQARMAGKLDEWVGPSVNVLLLREGIVADDGSRQRLIEAVDSALVQAASIISRNAEGDYRPDPDAARFPAWQPPGPSLTPRSDTVGEAVTIAELFERWATYSADKKAANTIKRYRGSFRSLSAFMKDRDVRSISSDDLYAWAEHRRDVEGVT